MQQSVWICLCAFVWLSVLGVFSGRNSGARLFGRQRRSKEWGPADIAGPYCENRPGGCCPGRTEECFVPFLNKRCFCDMLCNLTRDCCPDFVSFCLEGRSTNPNTNILSGPITPVVNCTEGHYCPPGTSVPEACPVGTYGNALNYSSDADCQSCTPGMYCETEGLTAPTGNCSAGHYCSGGAETARPLNHMVNSSSLTYDGNDICPMGYYCPEGSDYPTPCPMGTFSRGMGKDEEADCLLCLPGRYCNVLANTNNHNNLPLCDPGYVCVAGSTSKRPSDGTTGYICPAGFYCEAGTSSEVACAIGTFQDNKGQSFCLICPAGFMCLEINMTDPVVCKTGHYCVYGDPDPVPCPAGTYNNATGQAEETDCVDCTVDMLCEGTGKTFPDGIPQLLLANRKSILLVNVIPGAKTNVWVLISDLNDAVAVDFMYRDGYIFWTDLETETINRATTGNIHQSSVGILTTGIVSPDGLACDWVGRKLYWIDSETKRIEVSNLDGSHRSVLYWQGLDMPRAIALDARSGYMFWTDWGDTPKIERAGMDGTPDTRSVIVNDNIYWPNGLTLDHAEQHIYWTDAKLNYIHSCGFDGGQRRIVVDKDLSHPYALTLFEERLYWTDWQTEAIHSCDKTTGQDLETVINNLNSPMDLRAFSVDRQSPGDSPCGDDNGGCSHLCLMSPIKPNYKCACPTGVGLRGDQKTCADGPEEMLIFARRTDLRMISLDTPDFSDIVLPIDDIEHGVAVDYDPVEGYVYWTDDEAETIKRALLDGSKVEVLFTDVGQSDGLAVDWIGRDLYWTDTETDKIEVAKLNGSSRKVVISQDLDEPRALWLDPEHGYLWWTDWGKAAKIERANLDGTGRKVIIGKNLGWPNGVAVDYSEDQIYWCDAKRDMIEVANMDGTGRRVLVKDGVTHPFGFSLLGDYLYWTDWRSRSIERVHKRTGDNRTVILDQMTDLMGLKAVSVKMVTGVPTKPVTSCPEGHYCPAGTSVPEPCPIGTYGNALNFSSAADCQSCTPGMYCKTVGLTAPTGNCSAGHYCSGGADIASPLNHMVTSSNLTYDGNDICPMGHYCPGGSDYPTPCPIGTFSRGTGEDEESDCLPCLPGRYCNVLANTKSIYALPVCDPGYVCTAGSTSPRPNDGTTGYICPAGFYCEAGSSREMACPIGTFQDNEGQSTCVTCPAGFMCPENSVTVPEVCSTGHYCVYGDPDPVPCPKGTFNNATGQDEETDCVDCTVDMLCEGTGNTFPNGIPQLLLANRKNILLVNVIPGGNANVWVLISDLNDTVAVDFMYRDGYIFWTDLQSEMIKRATVGNIHQSSVGILTTGIVSPDGLACDWVGRKLYWTDSETKRIEVSNLDGSHRSVLYWQGLEKPRAIALDPFSGYMFWTDWGDTPKIERAGMDGTPDTRSVIVNDDIFWPNGLTLDHAEQQIYWTDAILNYIHSCDFDGGQRRTVVDKDLSHPYALTLFEERLYWTDWQTKAIHSCDKITGKDLQTIINDLYSPMDVRVFSVDRQPTGDNPCGDDNGGCSHLCLISPIKPNYKCACPTGVRLLGNQKTCAYGPEEMLLVARRTDLRMISLDTPDLTDIVLPIDDIENGVAVDYDPVEGYVYWTDGVVRTIKRALLDGSKEEVLITDVGNADGVAVDLIGRNLYWTDSETDRIEVARLNGTYRTTIIYQGLDEPRALWLDPEHGYMWWTDWGDVAKIERANLDGTNRKVIIGEDLGWPNGLAVDYSEDQIYWCDAKRNMIEVANMDGTGDYLYWTDWQSTSIERVHKRTGDNRTVILDQMPNLMGLKAVNVKHVTGSNPCGVNNGGCSHLCLFTPGGVQCACPKGLELIGHQETKCVEREAFLLFTLGSEINRMSISTMRRPSPMPLMGIKKPKAIDYDTSDKRIYWIDDDLKSISRAYMNGSAVEHIVEFVGVEAPQGMSVDWIAGNVYWADSGSKRIELARLDGSSRRVIVWKDLQHPVEIVLDPANGYMYWTDWADTPRLERAYLDGSLREVLLGNIGRIHGLSIDYAEARLYWADIDKQTIESCDLNGTNRVVVVDQAVSYPMALTLYEDSLYWADWKQKRIERADKITGGNRTVVLEHVHMVMDIAAFHLSKQSGSNKCNNNNCSHLCFALPVTANLTHRCACPTHYTLNPDNKTCRASNNFLLFAQKHTISRLFVEEGDIDGSPDIALPIKSLRNLKALDYDPLQKYMYWIDGRSKSIKRSTVDGSQNEVVVNGNAGIRPFDIAVDPYSHAVFWSCWKTNVVNFTRTDIKVGGVVVDDENQRPRYLAINPKKGHLYWANLANPATIQRSLYDGTESVTLFPTGLKKPGPITVDPTSNRLFWADSVERTIQVSDLIGTYRMVLLYGKQNDRVGRIMGLAVLGNYLYWADKSKQLIGRIPKNTGVNMTIVHEDLIDLSGIHAAVHVEPDGVGKHPCSKDNGGCSHICLPQEHNQVQCSCPNGLVLNDKINCAEKATCAPDMFTCRSESICIPIQWQCDMTADCYDGSDEENCLM